jgi:hypothetical protein
VRVYDVWIAFLALVGALGQWTSQNEVNYPPGHVEENIGVAWREFQLAWNHRHNPVELFAAHHDVAHVDRFARLVIELCNLERMVDIQIHPDNVDPPVIDRLLRKYLLTHYGFVPFQLPQGGVRQPPYIDYV